MSFDLLQQEKNLNTCSPLFLVSVPLCNKSILIITFGSVTISNLTLIESRVYKVQPTEFNSLNEEDPFLASLQSLKDFYREKDYSYLLHFTN